VQVIQTYCLSLKEKKFVKKQRKGMLLEVNWLRIDMVDHQSGKISLKPTQLTMTYQTSQA